MITDTTHTEQGTTYSLDLAEFTATVKKTKSKSLLFTLPDGAAYIADAGVLRKLLPACTVVEIALFQTAKAWTARGELIRPMYEDEKYSRTVWGPRVRGRRRQDLYSPEPRIGIIRLGRSYQGGRGWIYLYLCQPSDEREVDVCLVA